MRLGFSEYVVDTRANSGWGILPFDWPGELADLHVSGVVLNLGINDTVSPGNGLDQGYANYDAKIDWLLGELPVVPVVWSNLPCHLEPPARATGCAVVNAALARAEGRWTNLTVADWASAAPAHAIPPGDVHLTYKGALAWAEFVKSFL